MKLFQHISGLFCCALVALGLSSCLDSNDSETVVTNYYNCIVTSFSLVDNSNVCAGLSGYSFTIDNYGLSDDSIHALYPDDGIIFNPDSLPYGTIADSIKISVSFSSPDSAYLKLYGADGRLLQTIAYKGTPIELQLPSQGVFLLQATTAGGTFTRKIVNK